MMGVRSMPTHLWSQGTPPASDLVGCTATFRRAAWETARLAWHPVRDVVRPLSRSSTAEKFEFLRSGSESLIASRRLSEMGILPINIRRDFAGRTDTLYILGSARNVNELQSHHWRSISESDAIGFNSWTRHSFVPSYFAVQSFDQEIVHELASERYQNCTILVRAEHVLRGRAQASGLESLLSAVGVERVRFLPEVSVARQFGSISPKDTFSWLAELWDWYPGGEPRLFPKFRATIGLLVAVGFAVGYRRIVVCGVDPHRPGYFWDAGQGRTARHLCFLESGVWSHDCRWYAKNTLSAYVSEMSREMRRHGGDGIYSGVIGRHVLGSPPHWVE